MNAKDHRPGNQAPANGNEHGGQRGGRDALDNGAEEEEGHDNDATIIRRDTANLPPAKVFKRHASPLNPGTAPVILAAILPNPWAKISRFG